MSETPSVQPLPSFQTNPSLRCCCSWFPHSSYCHLNNASGSQSPPGDLQATPQPKTNMTPTAAHQSPRGEVDGRTVSLPMDNCISSEVRLEWVSHQRSTSFSKLKPRWNLHLWDDADLFTRPTEVLPPYLEGVPAPALNLSPNAHFTLVSV